MSWSGTNIKHRIPKVNSKMKELQVDEIITEYSKIVEHTESESRGPMGPNQK